VTLTSHYDALLAADRFAEPDFALGGLSAAAVRRRFVAADGDLPVPAAGTMVTTGVSMTGPPHLGTLAQMRTALALQRAGLDVQFVIADYEPYAGGRSRAAVRALAARYRALLQHLGFDADRGVCRPQTGTAAAREAMEQAFLLAPYSDDDVWDGEGAAPDTPFTEALSEAYDAAGGEWEGTSSADARTFSTVLHLADFLLPLADWGYERVLLVFGADETGLLPAGRALRERAGVAGRLDGLYTRLIPATDGAPKMSKRIPASRVDLSMPPETVRERVRGLPDDGPGSPGAAALALLSTRTGPLPDPGTEERAAALAELAEETAALARRWGRAPDAPPWGKD
jgi:tryptophanyl-tRNA synthetase